MKRQCLIVYLVALAAGLMAPSARSADMDQTEPSVPELKEVVVTAQKRPENLQEVPLSVAALSGQQLQEASVSNLYDLPNAVPGLSMYQGTDSKDYSPHIRGLGTSTYSNAIEPSVAAVIDGVVLGRQGMDLFNFDDVASVEVLRGPQGTLFGINSSAGVLNITTQEPTRELSGNVGLEYGSYDRIKESGSVSGPIDGDTLLGRVSVFSDKRDGYIHNLYTSQDLGWDSQSGIRAKLLYAPREQTSITLNVDMETEARSGAYFVPIEPSSDPMSQQLIGSTAYPGTHFMNASGTDKGARNSGKGASLQWKEAVGGGTLTDIAAYRTWYTLLNNNVGRTPILFFDKEYYEGRQHQWSNELRFNSAVGGPVDYLVGAFVFDEGLAALTDLRFNVGQPASPLFIRAIYQEQVDTLNTALFGNINFHVTSRITLFGGARATRVRLDARDTGLPVPADEPRFLVPEGVFANGVTDRNVSGRAGIRWQVSDGIMAYASAARGFKASAFNTETSDPNLDPVRPEIPTSYEVGMKSEWLNRRVRANGDLFYTTVKDFQAQSAITVGGAQPAFILQNAGKLRTKGAELEVDALPLENLMVNLNASYVDAVYADYKGSFCYAGQTAAQGCVNGVEDLTGKRLPYTPKWSAYASARYDAKIPGRSATAFVELNYSWRSDVEWDLSESPYDIERAYGLLGASVGIRGDHYLLRAYGQNLTNRTHGALYGAGPLATGTDPALSQQIPPDFKRIFGVGFDYFFGE